MCVWWFLLCTKCAMDPLLWNNIDLFYALLWVSPLSYTLGDILIGCMGTKIEQEVGKVREILRKFTWSVFRTCARTFNTISSYGFFFEKKNKNKKLFWHIFPHFKIPIHRKDDLGHFFIGTGWLKSSLVSFWDHTSADKNYWLFYHYLQCKFTQMCNFCVRTTLLCNLLHKIYTNV